VDPGSGPLERRELRLAISAAIVGLYAGVYGRGTTRARTFIEDDVVVCLLEDMLTPDELRLVEGGGFREVIDARVAFQEETKDEFSAAVERLTGRRVVAFLSANQTSSAVACELFFLEPAPVVGP
jgi:uncharacterized protein YbcI